jgi:hypothetical protein
MTKYYFLIDSNKKFSIGPFITLTNDDYYFGQIITSNDFCMEYKGSTPINFSLYSIETNSDYLTTKYYIQSNLNNIDCIYNIKKIGVFDKTIDLKTGIVNISDNNLNYSLQFKVKDNLIMCPSLTINIQ